MVFPSICWGSELSKHEVFGENRDGGGFVSVKCKQTSQVKSQADMPGRVPDAKGSPVSLSWELSRGFRTGGAKLWT